MSWLTLETSGGRTGCLPGEVVQGTAGWSLDVAPVAVEVRLFWYTEGRGTQDILIVDRTRFEGPLASERRDFRFELPAAPYTFSGKLISLRWALEVVALPSEEAQRLEITVGPAGKEILLGEVEP